MNTLNTVIELCCADIHSVQAAEIYKIPAIELCINLSCGGLTPGMAMVLKPVNYLR
ncbi:MAG: hypothetical protein IPM92_09785 [Saprospiraceae bacterium]|nr:hypothetical protein [Saprospiraceae bacterium]